MATRTRADTLKSVAVLLSLVAVMASGFLAFDLLRQSGRPHAPLVSAVPLGPGMTVLAASQDPGNDGIGLFRDIAVAGGPNESLRTLTRLEVRQLVDAGWKLRPTWRVAGPPGYKNVRAPLGSVGSSTIANDLRRKIYVALSPITTVSQYQSGPADGSGIYGAQRVLQALRDHRPILYVTLGRGFNNS